MATNLSPVDLAKLKAAFDRGERAIELNGKVYQPEFTGGTYSSLESGGQGGRGSEEGTLSGWMSTTPGEAKSSRMIDAYDANGAFTGQRADSYTNPLADVAKFGAAAYGLSALGGAMTGAMGAGTGGAAGLGSEFGGAAAEIAGADTAGYTAGMGLGEAAAGGTLGTTGLNTMRAGELASYGTGAAVTAPAVANGLTTAASSGITGALKDGWDILNTAAGTPVGKLVTGLAGTALAAGAADALAPDPDTSRINSLIDGMITDQGIARDRSKSMWDDYISTWKPIEQKFAQTALNYDTPERRQSEANAASGRVASQYDTARTSAERQAIASGVDPSTIATLGLNSRILEAKDRAGAENDARIGVETRGLSLLQGASNFGRNMPNSSLQQSGQATGAANSAVSAQNGLNATETNATNSRNAIFGDILGAGAQLYGMNSNQGNKGSLWSHIPGLSSLWGGGS